MAGAYGVYLSVLRRLHLSGELILRFIGRSSFLSAFLVGRRANVFPRRTVFFTVTVLLISLSRVLVKRGKKFCWCFVFLEEGSACCQTFIHIFFSLSPPPSPLPLLYFAFLSRKRNIVSVCICVLFGIHGSYTAVYNTT